MERGVRKVRFKGAHGVELDARVDLPAGEPVAWALFAHCFTCSKDIFAASRISQALTDHGFAVLRFDFTGLGSSEGEFANTTFSSNVEDLVAAAQWAREHGQAPSLLIGHSLGGPAVIRAAGQIPEVKAVATLNAPFCPEHVARLFEPVLEKIQSEGKAQVALGGRAVTITREFLEDISSQNMTQALRELRRALMIFHSPVDAVVDVENARQLYEAARHPKSFVSVDGADHLLSRKGDAIFVAGLIGAWATRYLGTPEADEGRALDPVAP
jgi:alpha/beta superfamily hydrolase